ncbi:cytidyltransferase-like domain protein [Mycoplasmopsis fermentans MF-I1]|nr:adenylyltransferase/cytidyltransferase family protein [Mycoplasmopsis fermentans]RMX36208.1 cytidyltransferase-like domain protein [Mycoplasmopsis fermentans MF-I1]
MKIGLFGGSFNPIHSGHIKIAEYAYKTLKLDKMFFIPTAISPFKKNNKVAPNKDRVNMINIAIENLEGNYAVHDFEIKKGGVIILLKQLDISNNNIQMMNYIS